MTKHEFISAVQEHERLAARWAKVLAWFIVAFIFALALVDYAEGRGFLNWFGATDPIKVLSVVWIVSVVAALGRFITLIARRRVCCPHCRQLLAGLSAQITVATGLCGHCGERVFDPSFKQV